MIQNSINQFLGMAGLAGGYLAKARSDIMQPEIDAAIDRKSKAIEGAQSKDDLKKVGEPKAQVRNSLTTPPSALMKMRVGESKLREQYWDKMNSLPDMIMNSEGEQPSEMMHPGDDKSIAARQISKLSSDSKIRSNIITNNFNNMTNMNSEEENK